MPNRRESNGQPAGAGADVASQRNRAEALFTDLVWPAAAGNVAWATVSVALVAGAWFVLSPQFLALLLLAWYLAADWSRMELRSDLSLVGRWYWGADALLIGSIVVFCIATANATVEQESNDVEFWWRRTFLMAVFFFAVMGHWTGAWREHQPRRDRQHVSSPFFLGLINLTGFGLLSMQWGFGWGDDDEREYSLVAALMLVLSIWWVYQTIYERVPFLRGRSSV